MQMNLRVERRKDNCGKLFSCILYSKRLEIKIAELHAIINILKRSAKWMNVDGENTFLPFFWPLMICYLAGAFKIGDSSKPKLFIIRITYIMVRRILRYFFLHSERLLSSLNIMCFLWQQNFNLMHSCST